MSPEAADSVEDKGLCVPTININGAPLQTEPKMSNPLGAKDSNQLMKNASSVDQAESSSPSAIRGPSHTGLGLLAGELHNMSLHPSSTCEEEGGESEKSGGATSSLEVEAKSFASSPVGSNEEYDPNDPHPEAIDAKPEAIKAASLRKKSKVKPLLRLSLQNRTKAAMAAGPPPGQEEEWARAVEIMKRKEMENLVGEKLQSELLDTSSAIAQEDIPIPGNFRGRSTAGYTSFPGPRPLTAQKLEMVKRDLNPRSMVSAFGSPLENEIIFDSERESGDLKDNTSEDCNRKVEETIDDLNK